MVASCLRGVLAGLVFRGHCQRLAPMARTGFKWNLKGERMECFMADGRAEAALESFCGNRIFLRGRRRWTALHIGEQRGDRHGPLLRLGKRQAALETLLPLPSRSHLL